MEQQLHTEVRWTCQSRAAADERVGSGVFLSFQFLHPQERRVAASPTEGVWMSVIVSLCLTHSSEYLMLQPLYSGLPTKAQLFHIWMVWNEDKGPLEAQGKQEADLLERL